MPSSSKTPFLNLHQWEKCDKFCMDDFNYDNKKIDEECEKIYNKISTHEKNNDVHITKQSLDSIETHIKNNDIHLTASQASELQKQLETLNSASQDISEIKATITSHSKDKSLHSTPTKLEKVKTLLSAHTQDKNIHVDPSDFSAIKSHVKNSKAHIDPSIISDLKSSLTHHSSDKKIHTDISVVDSIKSNLSAHTQDKNIHVDPVDFSAIKSHVKDSKAHFNESTLKKIDEHIANNSIHVDSAQLNNPFYFVGSYIGNGNDQQLITLPFNPSFVIVFSKNMPPVSVAKASGETIISLACCSKDSASVGLVPTTNGFIAQTTKTYQLNKIVKHLNTSGINYHYIAFR